MIAPVERVGYSVDLLPSRVQIAYAGAALGGSAAGLSSSWGYTNRTCAFRYASGSPEDLAKFGVHTTRSIQLFAPD